MEPAIVEAGQRIAAFTVVRHLHRSHHCDVYHVTDERGAPFAAKVVRPDKRADDVTVQRILVEGVRLAVVDHPHVLRCVRTIDEPPGNLLELIEGRTLRDVIKTSAPPAWGEVARLGSQIADALDAIHATGLLHGDVKPSNVLVAADRYVLIDLDLARPPGRLSGGQGTRRYMAPEQVSGGVLGPPIDAWGLGGLLFKAATGRAPFDDPVGYPQATFAARRVDEIRPGGGQVAALIDGLLDPYPANRPLLAWVAFELARLVS